jgi:hypothetical protein
MEPSALQQLMVISDDEDEECDTGIEANHGRKRTRGDEPRQPRQTGSSSDSGGGGEVVQMLKARERREFERQQLVLHATILGEAVLGMHSLGLITDCLTKQAGLLLDRVCLIRTRCLFVFGGPGPKFPGSHLGKELEHALGEAFPEFPNFSLWEIMVRLVGAAGELRLKTHGGGLLDVVEGYCGRAAITRACVQRLLRCRAYDATFGPSHNLLDPQVFRHFVLSICCLRMNGHLWLAPPCSSFVFLSQSVVKRAEVCKGKHIVVVES